MRIEFITVIGSVTRSHCVLFIPSQAMLCPGNKMKTALGPTAAESAGAVIFPFAFKTDIETEKRVAFTYKTLS